jgi:hypothetical protein
MTFLDAAARDFGGPRSIGGIPWPHWQAWATALAEDELARTALKRTMKRIPEDTSGIYRIAGGLRFHSPPHERYHIRPRLTDDGAYGEDA